jgi:phage tail-like protein
MAIEHRKQFVTSDPHASFRFLVNVAGLTQAVFTDCTLPDIDWDTEEVKEGGLNTYTHQLLGRRKAAKVTLKRGLVSDSFVDWYVKLMNEEFQGFKKDITITLVDAMHKPVMVWHITSAFPIKWTGPQLKTSESAVAVETLELACAGVMIEKAPLN